MNSLDAKDKKNPTLQVSAIHAQFSYLQGEILTIAEAAFTDKEQREAFKSLIRRSFSNRQDHIEELAYGTKHSSNSVNE